MPTKHAVLSASSSYRWLACPPSAQECAKVKDVPSEFALQGTDAHSLCEYKVLSALGRDVVDPTKGLTFFDEEMDECATEYAEFVMEQVEAAKTVCKDPLVLVEQRLGFSFELGTGRFWYRCLRHRSRRYADCHRLQTWSRCPRRC